jgi:hypothetical protein
MPPPLCHRPFLSPGRRHSLPMTTVERRARRKKAACRYVIHKHGNDAAQFITPTTVTKKLLLSIWQPVEYRATSVATLSSNSTTQQILQHKHETFCLQLLSRNSLDPDKLPKARSCIEPLNGAVQQTNTDKPSPHAKMVCRCHEIDGLLSATKFGNEHEPIRPTTK